MNSGNSRNINHRLFFYALIVVAIVLFSVSFYFSLNGQTQEVNSYSFDGGSLTVSPSVIYIHSFLWYSPSAVVSVFLDRNVSTVNASVFQINNISNPIFSQTFHNVSFLSFDFGLSVPGTPQVERYYIAVNGLLVNISVSFTNSPDPLGSEITLLLSFASLMAGIYFAPFRSRLWILPIAISYLVLATFFGQRYDMFFMISGGLHILSGVNPFIRSIDIPGSLKWSYPPYYLVWSTVSDFLSGLITHTPLPSPSSLIFPAVRIGNYYDAWLGFIPSSLPVYYLLAKVPMVLSVFGIYYLLLKKFNLHYNLTKIWLLSPFVILIGVVWGQLDIIASLFLLSSIYFMKKERTDLAILLSVVGFWVKIFPVFIFPFILISSKNKLRDLGIAVLSSIPAALIYLFSGNFVTEIEVMIYSRSVPTFNGVFFAQGLSWQVIISRLGIPHFPPIFLYLFIPFLITLCIVYYYKRGDVVNYVIMEFLFFFLTYNFVDPQYLIVLVPLFLINRDLWNYTVFSLYPLLLTFLNYSFTYFVVPSLSINYFASPLGQQETLRTWITSSNLFIFPLVSAFTISVIVTMVMIAKNKRFNFLNGSIFSG